MDKKDGTYDARPSTEDQEELLSSTDVDDLHMDEEKQWYSQKLESTRRLRGDKSLLCTSYRWIIDAFLILIIIVLVILLRIKWMESSSSNRQVGGDYTGGGPNCE
jgi:hypothetical protein